mmetsp:Transcript_9635/g.39291  ORF Transcript_9635/g.39291 Transcript_9635/m.39291 type:complete len:398 (+) Transcript_9635:1168-2361(+)
MEGQAESTWPRPPLMAATPHAATAESSRESSSTPSAARRERMREEREEEGPSAEATAKSCHVYSAAVSSFTAARSSVTFSSSAAARVSAISRACALEFSTDAGRSSHRFRRDPARSRATAAALSPQSLRARRDTSAASAAVNHSSARALAAALEAATGAACAKIFARRYAQRKSSPTSRQAASSAVASSTASTIAVSSLSSRPRAHSVFARLTVALRWSAWSMRWARSWRKAFTASPSEAMAGAEPQEADTWPAITRKTLPSWYWARLFMEEEWSALRRMLLERMRRRFLEAARWPLESAWWKSDIPSAYSMMFMCRVLHDSCRRSWSRSSNSCRGRDSSVRYAWASAVSSTAERVRRRATRERRFTAAKRAPSPCSSSARLPGNFWSSMAGTCVAQ